MGGIVQINCFTDSFDNRVKSLNESLILRKVSFWFVIINSMQKNEFNYYEK